MREPARSASRGIAEVNQAFRRHHPGPCNTGSLFERFTEPARQVVVLAQDEARALGHNYIGTEHILLGLLREREGMAARVLGSLGITVESVRGQVTRIVGAGEQTVTGQIPFTPRAKKVLELSLREALTLGHNHIGTEHVLLGLLREHEGVAVRVLVDSGVGPETVRASVLEELGNPSIQVGSGRWPGRPRRRPRRFEYRMLQLGSSAELTESLLEPLGADRWERVSVLPDGAGLRLIFQRTA
jgi:hypothetical protein